MKNIALATLSSSVLGCLAALLLSGATAQAQQCNTREFTISDVEQLKTSEITAITAYATLDKSLIENSEKNGAITIPIHDVPVSLSYNEKKAIAERMLQSSGFTFASNKRLSFLRTTLSATGAQMYKDCLAVQQIAVSFPQSAYSDTSFFMVVKWLGNYPRAPEQALASIRVDNGKVEGKDSFGRTIRRQGEFSVKITKTSGPLHIAVDVDASAYPPIDLPGIMHIQKYSYRVRTGIGDNRIGGPANQYVKCTDTAYLVSEVGSVAGNNPKSCRICVDAAQNGILLPSTAFLDAQLSARGAYMKNEASFGNLGHACGHFWTSGAGQGSGRFEVDNGRFQIGEVYPSGN